MLKMEPEKVKFQLQQLDKAGIVIYKLRNESAQLYFHEDRQPSAQLWFDIALIKQQKERLQQRISAMIAYAKSTNSCKSAIIRKYFGDTEALPCGICDYCLTEKSRPLTSDKKQKLLQAIEKLAQTEKHPERIRKELKAGLHHFTECFQFLVAEKIIALDADGLIILPP